MSSQLEQTGGGLSDVVTLREIFCWFRRFFWIASFLAILAGGLSYFIPSNLSHIWSASFEFDVAHVEGQPIVVPRVLVGNINLRSVLTKIVDSIPYFASDNTGQAELFLRSFNAFESGEGTVLIKFKTYSPDAVVEISKTFLDKIEMEFLPRYTLQISNNLARLDFYNKALVRPQGLSRELDSLCLNETKPRRFLRCGELKNLLSRDIQGIESTIQVLSVKNAGLANRRFRMISTPSVIDGVIYPNFRQVLMVSVLIFFTSFNLVVLILGSWQRTVLSR